MSGTHLTDPDITVIRELAALGSPARQIARIVGRDQKTVRRHIPAALHAERLLAARFPPSKLDDALIWRLAAEGRSWREIGLIAGCNGETARQRYTRLCASSRSAAMVPAWSSSLDIARLKALVAAGHAREDVARVVGCTTATIRKHCPGARSHRDVARGDRLLRAWDATPPGERGDLVARFGYRTYASMHTMICRLRKRRTAERLAAATLLPLLEAA